jgi:uncharacterized protein YbjQ (UPF0145 family)
MKKFLVFLLFLPLAIQAEDVFLFPVQTVIEMGKARGSLDKDMEFYFGDQPYREIEVGISKGSVANKKTNGLNKDDDESCNWAMLSALIHLQKIARKQGGNAVVNIVSYYKKNTYKSDSQYECHVGSVVTGVALKGDVVKLKR